MFILSTLGSAEAKIRHRLGFCSQLAIFLQAAPLTESALDLAAVVTDISHLFSF